MIYFHGKDDSYALKARTAEKISLEIGKWIAGDYNWIQSSNGEKGKVNYILQVSKADARYRIIGNERTICTSDSNGILKFKVDLNKKSVPLRVVLNE